MKRTALNPWDWSLKFGFNQGEIHEGAQRQLVCAGQTAVDADGNPQHPGDMRQQMMLAMDNLETILSAAEMGLADVTGLKVYTTNMDDTLTHMDVLGARFGAVNALPPMSLLGVTRLAVAPLMFEISATAAR